MIRLGLVLDQILFSRAGRYSTDEVFIRFVESVARARFDRVRFCSRVRAADEDAPYPLDPDFFEIVAVPWYRDIPELCVKAPWLLPRIGRALDADAGSWGLAIASGIHPLSALTLRKAKRRGLPAILWIRGSLMADLAHRARGARKWAALAAARLCLAAIPSGVPVVSMGRDDFPFFRRMGPVQVAYSSKFRTSDLVSVPRPPRAAGAPVRILYVGRLAPEKGLEVLVDALRALRARVVPSPDLTVVGSDFFGSTWGAEFTQRVRDSDLGGAIAFTGHVPYGPELLAIYDTHDLLVLPSFTEGFPQVLLEAMARRVPVVATRVGGVASLVRPGENGLLVPPGDAEALALVLEGAVTDDELRARLSARGVETARAYTSEVQVDSVARFLDRCFPSAEFARRARGEA